jgi:hypothetical protein
MRRPSASSARRRAGVQRADVDLHRAERDEPAVLLHLAEQLLDAGPRGPPAQVCHAALACRAVQQRVELGAAVGRELIGKKQLDVAVGVGARGRDHPRERIDRRTQQPAGAQVLGDEDHQRCRRVMFDGALHQPSRELLAIAVTDAPPLQVGEDELQVVAARLRACPVGQQLVRGGVDLARDEPEGLVRDRGDVVGHEPKNRRAYSDTARPRRLSGPRCSKIRTRSRSESAKHARRSSTAMRSGKRSSRLRSASFGYPTPASPRSQKSICRSSTARWRSAADGSV